VRVLQDGLARDVGLASSRSVHVLRFGLVEITRRAETDLFLGVINSAVLPGMSHARARRLVLVREHQTVVLALLLLRVVVRQGELLATDPLLFSWIATSAALGSEATSGS